MDEDKKRRLQELAQKQAEEQGITEDNNTEDDLYITNSYSYQDDYFDYYDSSKKFESSKVNDDSVQTPVTNINVDLNMGGAVTCPKCGSNRIMFQRESSGNIGLSQNTVREAPEKKHHGLMYWISFHWFLDMCLWPFKWFGRLITGRSKQKKWNFSGNKNLNHTVAVCQNCGYSWKYKAKKIR